ncbi:outer membrane protein assembly factor BamB [Catenulispora sp. GAS73]|uniref:protein kinase domain-containing protein n=1 Tax=Catenulispora sp. GAS73 TaxID=3156269 RepID=UPI00351424C6
MVGAVGAVGAAMGPLTEGDPRRVGPHSTVGRLGVGALGPLYGGYSDDGRAVAVRALRPELLADETVKARLAADVAAARTVTVPYAAPVLGAELEGEAPWLASAFVAGVPLPKVVADHGPLPEPALLSLAAGLAEALAAVHAAGVMHGDLRPGTVLLTPEGPCIVDYALVRAFDGATDGGVAELGVAGFLAPEQALGRTVTPAADMFALGSTLFFAATGRPPFGEGTRDEVKKRVAKSSPVLGKLPAALGELIRGCLQKDPNGRAQPQQVAEYVRRRAPIPLGSGWLPPALAEEVRAAAAAGLGSAAGPDPDANATIVVAPRVAQGAAGQQQADGGVAFAGSAAQQAGGAAGRAGDAGSGAPGLVLAAGGGQLADGGVAFAGSAAQQAGGAAGRAGDAGSGAPGLVWAAGGGQLADGGVAFAGSAAQQAGGVPGRAGDAGSGAPGLVWAAGGGQQADRGAAFAGAVPVSGGQMPGFAQQADGSVFYQQSGAPGGRPAPSRRNLLLALSGGAVVAVGGTAVALGLGGSSGTTTTADAKPSTGAVGAVPSATRPSASGPGFTARLPLPKGGPLSPPVGAAGTLQGPDATPFWSLPGGGISSLAAGDGVLVVCGESGVSGYDFGANLKWGPVRATGVRGSGNGVVDSGVVYLIVASAQGGGAAGGELLALDVETGVQKWRAATPQGPWPDLRVGGALGGVVFLVGTSGGVPAVWAVDAGSGRSLWQKSGVDFATLAVPSSGAQVLTAGAGDPNTGGAVTALDIRSGDQAWSRPWKSSVDYGHVSLNKIACAGDHYVLLLSDQPEADTLTGGSATSGPTAWSVPLPVPPGDAGTIALVTCLPDADAVVVLSRHGVYAADAQTGQVRWQSQGTESFATASDAGAPQSADGNVYVPDQQGTWWAVDFTTGRTRWKYTVPGYDRSTDPVWIAVSGGVVVSAGGTLALVSAGG